MVATSGGSRAGWSVLVVRSAAGWAAGTGAVALVGWWRRVPALTRVLPTLPAMVPLTAAVLVLAGAGLWLLGPEDAGRARRLAGLVAAAAVAGAGAAVLVEYAGAVDFGVDRLLFAGRVDVSATGGAFPGRPSPHTAAAFLAAGLALLLLDARTRTGRLAASVLAPVTALISLSALLGYVYGVGYLRGLTPVTGMSVHTAVALLVLAAGILAAREDRPIVRAFTGAGPGGTLVRRISPVLLGLPFAVGLIAATSGRAQHDTALAVTATTATTFVALAVVVVPTARALEASYSARLRLVAELRRQRDFDASLLASMHEGVIVLDHALCIVEANPRFCEMLGRPREEVVGVGPPWPWWPQPEADRLAEPVSALQERGHQLSAETVLRRPDGSEMTVLVYSAPLPGTGEEGRLFLSTVVDITERVEAQAERERLRAQAERERLERQLHQSQRLESLGQLAGGVAHDFNNLLAVILNYATFVEEEVSAAAADEAADQGAGRWPQVRGDVEQIRRAAERATALTHQLLAFGRREIVQPRVLNLNDVVRDIEQLLRRTLGEHIQLDTALAGDLRPVLADPGQIEQVLVNLAVNARDAMPTGGTLTIATANVDLDDEQAGLRPGLKTGPHALLRVTDIGTGMPKEVLERAFEPFFTTKPKGEGTGLGLATIYGIITQADGHAEIQSEPGRGTTFTALLPITDQVPAPAETAAAAQPVRGGETILVVEDEDAMREVTRRILTRNGYEVLTAARGADALTLAAAADRCIHLLITDVIMPQMLGNDVADRLRATRPGIRTLFMSGYAHSVLTSTHTLEPGVTLIEKPFTESALLAKVRQVLDGRDESGTGHIT